MSQLNYCKEIYGSTTPSSPLHIAQSTQGTSIQIPILSNQQNGGGLTIIGKGTEFSKFQQSGRVLMNWKSRIKIKNSEFDHPIISDGRAGSYVLSFCVFCQEINFTCFISY